LPPCQQVTKKRIKRCYTTKPSRWWIGKFDEVKGSEKKLEEVRGILSTMAQCNPRNYEDMDGLLEKIAYI